MAKDDFFEDPKQEELYDKLVDALDRAYHRPWLMMWRSFLQGIMSAFGTAVGWILILIVSGFIFQALGGINLFKPLVNRLQGYLQQSQSQGAPSKTQSLYTQIEQNNGSTASPTP